MESGEENATFHDIDEDVHMKLPEEVKKSWFNLNPVGVLKLYNLLSFPKDLYTKVYFNSDEVKWLRLETDETTSASPLEELHVYGKLS